MIKVYQNYYADEVAGLLDPAFIPYDRRSNEYPEYREIGVFLSFYESGRYRDSEYVGILSPKFGIKTKISGQVFLDFVKANPGYDVYFINPFPQNSYHSYNVWEHGEMYHPGIKQLTQLLFDKAGYNLTVEDMGRNDADTLLYCNYWVGNQKFWEEYMEFIIPLFDCITKKMNHDDKQRFFNFTYHVVQMTPMFPFIFERLFSTFLLLRPDIKACPFRHSKQQIKMCCLTEVEWDIVNYFADMIDCWDRRGTYDTEQRKMFSGFMSIVNQYNRLKWSIEGTPY